MVWDGGISRFIPWTGARFPSIPLSKGDDQIISRRHPAVSDPNQTPPNRLEDHLLAHPFYQRAARGLVSCYLRAHAAQAALGGGEAGGEPDYSGMTAEERKRAKVGGCGCGS